MNMNIHFIVLYIHIYIENNIKNNSLLYSTIYLCVLNTYNRILLLSLNKSNFHNYIITHLCIHMSVWVLI